MPGSCHTNVKVIQSDCLENANMLRRMLKCHNLDAQGTINTFSIVINQEQLNRQYIKVLYITWQGSFASHGNDFNGCKNGQHFTSIEPQGA